MITELNEPKQAAKLTKQHAEAIARLIVKQKSTETDACHALQIKPAQWFKFKERRLKAGQFDNLLARIRENKLSGFIDRIEQAGENYEITLPNGKVINKQGDWRALAWLADKEKRFQPESTGQSSPVTIQIGLVHEQLKRVIGFTNDSNYATMPAERLLPAPSDIVADSKPKLCMPIRKSVD